MADETEEPEGRKKSSVLLLIVAILLVLVLVAVSIFGTLYITGFFKEKEPLVAEGDVQAGAAQSAKAAAGKASDAEPKPLTKSSPEQQRFEYRYVEFEKELLANLAGSRKFMLVKIAVMTRYDDRVLNNIKRHEFAMRSAALDIMRQSPESEVLKPEFRKLMAERMRTEFNAVLDRLENFGGIEEVYFTSFVVQ
jgi:flagellar FliL protein